MSIDFNQVDSPCYLLEEAKLEKNLKLLQYVQEQSGANIILALKGFAMFSAFPLIKQYLRGTTASSLNEALLGKHEFGHEVHVYSPAYLDAEMPALLEIARHITFNSLSQWERYKAQILASPHPVSPGLRINPEHSVVDTTIYDPCAPGTRLGIKAKLLGDTLPEGIEGLHFHSLCESTAEALEGTLKKVEARFGKFLQQIKWLNIGGGHAITRKDYDVEILIGLIKYFREKYGLEVILEPGSAVGWQCGYLVSTVLDIVEGAGIKTAILDTSFTSHMPDCLEMPYQPKILGAKKGDKGDHIYRMGGLTCLAGDFMGDYSFPHALSVGDRIVFDDMMHYTMVKNNTFNGVNLPTIGVWKTDGSYLPVKKFGYEAYRSRLS